MYTASVITGGTASLRLALRTAMDPIPPLLDYLDRQSQKPHRLATLVRESLAGDGYHTPREILQQPFLWRDTANRMRGYGPDLRAFLDRAGLFDEENPACVLFTGAGTSDYAGLSLINLYRDQFRTFAENYSTTRITSSPAQGMVAGCAYVMIHFARSGNSPESRAVLEMALRRRPDDVRHVIITCNGDGELAKMARADSERAFLVVLNEATNDHALAMTSSFTSMVIAAQSLVHLTDMSVFVDLVDRIASAAEHLIERHSDDIAEIASEEIERAFFLGNNDLFGAAAESALKIQELTRGDVVAKSDDPLGFRHGPISAVGCNSLVAMFLSGDPFTRRYELDVIIQYQQAFHDMCARAVLIGESDPGPEIREWIRVISYDPDNRWSIPPLYQVVLGVLFGQMLAVFASLHRELNVDDPTGSTPLYSRTVQGVTLYDFEDAL